MPRLQLGAEVRAFELTFMDCDGVIFDANALKERAFVQAVASYPEAARQQLAEHHRGHGGISRYAKFRHFFEHIHPVDDVEEAIAQALERFGAIAKAGYAELTPRPEALRFASHMGGAERVVVVSGADQTELRAVFAGQGLADRFAAIYGSPTPKGEHMAAIMARRGLSPDQVLMVGDGRGDLEAARGLGIPFVFLREMSKWQSADDHLGDYAAAHVADRWAVLLEWLVSP